MSSDLAMVSQEVTVLKFN